MNLLGLLKNNRFVHQKSEELGHDRITFGRKILRMELNGQNGTGRAGFHNFHHSVIRLSRDLQSWSQLLDGLMMKRICPNGIRIK